MMPVVPAEAAVWTSSSSGPAATTAASRPSSAVCSAELRSAATALFVACRSSCAHLPQHMAYLCGANAGGKCSRGKGPRRSVSLCVRQSMLPVKHTAERRGPWDVFAADNLPRPQCGITRGEWLEFATTCSGPDDAGRETSRHGSAEGWPEQCRTCTGGQRCRHHDERHDRCSMLIKVVRCFSRPHAPVRVPSSRLSICCSVRRIVSCFAFRRSETLPHTRCAQRGAPFPQPPSDGN